MFQQRSQTRLIRFDEQIVSNARLDDLDPDLWERFKGPRFCPSTWTTRFTAYVDSPEDDSPTTAPSKRIEALVPGYQKPVMGTLAAQEIGLQTMREACPHFGQWIARLDIRAPTTRPSVNETVPAWRTSCAAAGAAGFQNLHGAQRACYSRSARRVLVLGGVQGG